MDCFLNWIPGHIRRHGTVREKHFNQWLLQAETPKFRAFRGFTGGVNFGIFRAITIMLFPQGGGIPIALDE
jgi:hypothetical protein